MKLWLAPMAAAFFFASATMPGSWTWESFPPLPGGLFGRREMVRSSAQRNFTAAYAPIVQTTSFLALRSRLMTLDRPSRSRFLASVMHSSICSSSVSRPRTPLRGAAAGAAFGSAARPSFFGVPDFLRSAWRRLLFTLDGKASDAEPDARGGDVRTDVGDDGPVAVGTDDGVGDLGAGRRPVGLVGGPGARTGAAKHAPCFDAAARGSRLRP